MGNNQILVIDNDVFYLELLSDILEGKGYVVKKASDGLQGLEMIKKESFYCLFVDLIMPKIDGVKLIKCIREDLNLEKMSIIVVSAALSEEYSDLNTIGADYYLFKGPIEDIKKNILGILSELENKDRKSGKVSRILGAEGMYQRAVVKELMSSMRHQEVVLGNMGEGVIEIDSGLTVTYINLRGMKIFKKSQSQIIGVNLYDLFSKNGTDLKIKEAIEEFSTNFLTQVKTLTLPYNEFMLKFVIANLIEKGENKGAVLIVEDVTDHYASLENLRKSLEGIIQAMALTVETRDPYTAGHQRRVADLACSIATELGLSEEQINGIRFSGLIHDLGKISVPAEILSKPGRINELEFNLIKSHPQVGYDILRKIEFPWPIAQIVLQHHERIDGSGYLQGLSGQDILMEARVLAVADIVEAMASHRPYRPALGVDKALEEISQNKGILYDPCAAEACSKVFAEKGYRFP